MTGFIYILRCCDFAKVGFSTKPSGRIRYLLSATPFEIDLVATHPGTMKDEQRLHAYLAPHHHRGEWFRWCEAIEQIAHYGIPHADLPSRGRTSFAIRRQQRQTDPKTVADIIGLWPTSEAFAEDLGLKRGGDHARVMKVRGRIPRSHWPRVLEGAARRHIPITERHLERAHDREPEKAAS